MAALLGGSVLAPSWLLPGLSPELDSSPGSPLPPWPGSSSQAAWNPGHQMLRTLPRPYRPSGQALDDRTGWGAHLQTTPVARLKAVREHSCAETLD